MPKPAIHCPHWQKVNITEDGVVNGCPACEKVGMTWDSENRRWNKPQNVEPKPKPVAPQQPSQPLQPPIPWIVDEVQAVLNRRKRPVVTQPDFEMGSWLKNFVMSVSAWPEFLGCLTGQEWSIWKFVRFQMGTPEEAIERFAMPLDQINTIFESAVGKLEARFNECLQNRTGRFKDLANKLYAPLSGDRAFERRERQKMTLAAVSELGLTELQMRIMTFYIDGMSVREMAERTGVPKTTLDREIQTATDRIKSVFQAQRSRGRVSKTFRELAEVVFDPTSGGRERATWDDPDARYEVRLALRGGGWDDGDRGDNPFNEGPARLTAFGGARITNKPGFGHDPAH
jgi:hypothetical protein